MALLFLFTALVIVPAIEIALFVAVGDEIGAFATIILTFGTAILGIAMVRIQGIGLLLGLRGRLNAGAEPEEDLLAGALLVIAALFLLIPGFFTDTLGFLLLIPPVRTWLVRSSLSGRSRKRASVHIIDGNFREVDDDDDDHRPPPHSRPLP